MSVQRDLIKGLLTFLTSVHCPFDFRLFINTQPCIEVFTGTDYVNNYCSIKKTYNHSMRWWLKHLKIFDFSLGGKKRVKTCEQPPPPRTVCKPRCNLSRPPPSLLPAETTMQEAQGHLELQVPRLSGSCPPTEEVTIPLGPTHTAQRRPRRERPIRDGWAFEFPPSLRNDFLKHLVGHIQLKFFCDKYRKLKICPRI